MGEFTVRANFGDRPQHHSVLELVVTGPCGLDESRQLRNTALESIRLHQPQTLLVNLSGFLPPFNAPVLGALVEIYVAMAKLGASRRYALVAGGPASAKLEEILRATKMDRVLGCAFPDVEAAVSGARQVLAPQTPPAHATSPAAPSAPVPPPLLNANPGIWFPDLQPGSTLRFTEVVGLVMAGTFVAVIGPAMWRPLIWLWAIPFALLLVYFGSEGVRAARNSAKRARWSRSFDGPITARRAEAMLKEDPERYFAHSRSYGGFDTTKLDPVMLVEDLQTGKRFPVA